MSSNDDDAASPDDAPQEQTTVELSLRLDRDGRTAYAGRSADAHREEGDAAAAAAGGPTDDAVVGTGTSAEEPRSATDDDAATAAPPSDENTRSAPEHGDGSNDGKSGKAVGGGCGGGGRGDDRSSIDYASRTVPTLLSEKRGEEERDSAGAAAEARLDDLLFDCEVADCAILPRTFWVSAEGATAPRCALERMALEVFRHHVPEGYDYDPSTSGAEWWVQLRPSPEGTGRYSMLMGGEGGGDNDNGDDDMSKGGISFHWDKDEELRLATGGTMHVHPHVSTVTYLTGLGAPTACVNWRVNNFTGEYVLPSSQGVGVGGGNGNGDGASAGGGAAAGRSDRRHECFVSCPRRGKHLSFDGRYLHAAPPDLMADGEFERQCAIGDVDEAGSDKDGTDDDADAAERDGARRRNKALERRHRRVTFLVNVWLNYRPLNVEPFPEGMVDKLSGGEGDDGEGNNDTRPYLFDDRRNTCKGQSSSGSTCEARDVDMSADQSRGEGSDFTWPLGGCESDDAIGMTLPLRAIREELKAGGSVRVVWSEAGGGGGPPHLLRKGACSAEGKRALETSGDHPENGCAASSAPAEPYGTHKDTGKRQRND